MVARAHLHFHHILTFVKNMPGIKTAAVRDGLFAKVRWKPNCLLHAADGYGLFEVENQKLGRRADGLNYAIRRRYHVDIRIAMQPGFDTIQTGGNRHRVA